jgi:hypothetical protein
MTAYEAWLVGYFEGHRQGMRRHAPPARYNHLFGGDPAGDWTLDIHRFDSVGLLQEFTEGFEDGLAVSLFDCGMLYEEPKYCRPPKAEEESFLGGFPAREWAHPAEKEREAREAYLRTKGRV